MSCNTKTLNQLRDEDHTFSQILQKVRRDSFSDLVEKHQSNKHSEGNDAWSHFVTMLFCQFAKCDSLNDISNGMRSATGDHNHLGVSVDSGLN
ncbi:MAG: DUF4372 domain-containing protein [Pseudomonadota bacterium]